MADPNYTVRTMTREEVDIAIDCAAEEGWNPGLYDAGCFYAADPQGFFIGLSGNTPVATISAVKYGDSLGMIGCYIVKPEHRGRGCGIEIWKAALKYLEGRNMGGDGVVAQQENYKKAGFFIAWRNLRHEGRGGGIFPQHPQIVSLSELPLKDVCGYDRIFFPEGRDSFLGVWIAQPECKALGFKDNGRLAGYGVIRRCRKGFKIGPLFAHSPEAAAALFESLISGLDESDLFYLDTPEPNKNAMALAERFEMKVMFETARMYSGKQPDIPLDGLYGITSFELG